MNKKENAMMNELTEEMISEIAGGVCFKTQCTGCGKDISYARHRWGKEEHDTFTLCKGYFCDDCVEKFHNGEIKDEELLKKFNQLDKR